ncbi:hypothetical protein V5N11_015552 [Cardamine amara subsp. amara]|uniref:Tf2-1-like SH3-like domain-containing protein n=1 Tax=Cardamine amara subsp. amara TaxID=228776 RepID=A0ABD0Z813_CARAN
MKKAQDRQKSYADRHRREIEFKEGDWVYLKVAATKGKDRFGKVGKIGVRYIGLYQIEEKIGKVAYRLIMPEIRLHKVFHVSMLRRHVPDPDTIDPERIEELTENLTYPEGVLEVEERRIRKLKKREISQIQVFWGKQNRKVTTWEDEESFRVKYPQFFTISKEDEVGPSTFGRIWDEFS